VVEIGVGYGFGDFWLYYGHGLYSPWPYYWYTPWGDLGSSATYVVVEPNDYAYDPYLYEQRVYATPAEPPNEPAEGQYQVPEQPLSESYAPPTESPGSAPAQPGQAQPPQTQPGLNQQQPQNVQTSPESARQFARQGEQAFKQRDYKEAVRLWRHALVDDPANGAVTLLLAQALFQTGSYEEAAGAVQRALLLLPKDQWGIVVANYEELYTQTQDYVDALRDLEQHVLDEPKNPAYRFLVGYHYLYLGYPVEAAQQLKKLTELAPKDKLGQELLKVAEERKKAKQKKSEGGKNEKEQGQKQQEQAR